MRPATTAMLCLAMLARAAGAQASDTTATARLGPVSHDKTFLTRRDLAIAGIAVGATALLSIYDDDVALAARETRFQSSGLQNLALDISKVNETTLTIAGLATYGVGRLTHARTVTDVALHATEAVVLASLSSQLIRGPLGRARPHVTGDTNQYSFQGFKGFSSFDRRAFPSIHTSSSMAVATVLTMELQRRHNAATPFVAPLLFAAGILPGLARIQLDQHWASDIAAGAFMGVFAGYKVVSYSHDHPGNAFDRVLQKMSVVPEGGGVRIGIRTATALGGNSGGASRERRGR